MVITGWFHGNSFCENLRSLPASLSAKRVSSPPWANSLANVLPWQQLLLSMFCPRLGRCTPKGYDILEGTMIPNNWSFSVGEIRRIFLFDGFTNNTTYRGNGRLGRLFQLDISLFHRSFLIGSMLSSPRTAPDHITCTLQGDQHQDLALVLVLNKAKE